MIEERKRNGKNLRGILEVKTVAFANGLDIGIWDKRGISLAITFCNTVH